VIPLMYSATTAAAAARNQLSAACLNAGFIFSPSTLSYYAPYNRYILGLYMLSLLV
jgi:hypothetical protein